MNGKAVDLNLFNGEPSHTVILAPGDKVIFKFDQPLSNERADHITQQIRAALGEDLNFLVIDNTIEVGIVNQEETA